MRTICLDQRPGIQVHRSQCCRVIPSWPLPMVQSVSSTFRGLADVLLLEHFLEKWGVTLDEQGHPPAPTVLPGVTQDSFVWRHTLTRGDTLPRIAIKYRTDVPTLKRRNMILSDHTLATRDCIYVPGMCKAGCGCWVLPMFLVLPMTQLPNSMKACILRSPPATVST